MASRVALGPIETVTVNNMVTGPRTTVAIGSSPCSLVNSCSTRIGVAISGGTVTAIELSKDDGTFDNVGLLGGLYPINPGDVLRITYVVGPVVAFAPI